VIWWTVTWEVAKDDDALISGCSAFPMYGQHCLTVINCKHYIKK